MAKHIWRKQGFEDFSKGTLGNGGQNLYVSAKGILQRIHLYDMTGNGYPDLIFSNSQSMGERPKIDVYRGKPGSEAKKLRNRGTFDGTMADLTGDGRLDLIVACQHDGVTSDITSMIYYSSPEGYTEKYMTELYAPSAVSVSAADFRGIGKADIAFAGDSRIRLFEQTELGIEPTVYRDLDINAISTVADDLDGDGYSDLYVLTKDGDLRVYWGGKDGINSKRYTELECKVAMSTEVSTSTAGRLAFAFIPWCCAVVNIYGKKCIFYTDGEYAIFDSFDADRCNKNVLKIKVKGATHAASGNLTGAGDDLVITTSAGLNSESESLLLLKAYGYALDKATRFTTRGARCATISALEPSGREYLFIAQVSTRRDNDVDSLTLSFKEDGALDTCESFGGHCTMRVLVGDSGIDGCYESVVLNHESGRWSGEENIYVYLGDKNGYSADRRLEYPGLSAVEGQFIDFTDNGHPDLIVVSCAENQPNLCRGLNIYHNDGNGPEIDKCEDVPAPLPHGIAIGDFRHSGYLDIAVGGIHSREMYVYEGGPDGYSKDRMKKFVFGPEPFVPYEWTTDNLDAAVYSDEEMKNINKYGQFRWMFTADLNGDGYLDLIIPHIIGPDTYIMWGGPDGFSKDNMQRLATVGAGCANVADLNGNGYPDLILGGHLVLGKNAKKESYVTVYWNGSEGLCENRKTSLPAWCVNSLAIADYNGDGVLDIFATSYSNDRVRDLDSYIYFGDKEKGFSMENTQRIFNNSGCGCLAGDFNGDGYVDLAVGSHKKEGDHVCESFVYWGGPDGIREDRCTALPTKGVHGMTTVDIGNIMDRSDDEFYYSEPYAIPEGMLPKSAIIDAECAKTTSVSIEFRTADTVEKLKDAPYSRKYSSGEKLEAIGGKYMQYRLTLTAKSGCGTPRVKAVDIIFE